VPTWGEVLSELAQSAGEEQPVQFDAIRRKYLATLHAHTGRNVILYATKWTQTSPAPPSLVSISDEDLQGLMEVIHGLQGGSLDLILHSPGGAAEAAEAWVHYLRSKFDDIRVIVPSMAMSAATMLACAGDTIVLGKHSFLGPIDPQIIMETPLGVRAMPAQAVLAQFAMALDECRDQEKLNAWYPMLSQYGPALLIECRNACSMAEELVVDWLSKYMFSGETRPREKARRIARWLSDHRRFKSHGRRIPRDELLRRGLRVDALETDQQLQDLVLSVFHATTHTFDGTPAVKIIENHAGHAFIKSWRMFSRPEPTPSAPG